MNLILKGYWSNNPIPVDEVIQNPEIVLRVPVGMVGITADINKAYVDEQDSLLSNEFTTGLQTLDDKKANAIAVSQALGTKADLVNGVIPASQLPSFVDDVLEGTYVDPVTFNDLAGNPYTPEGGKIYVDVNLNTNYRWSGMLFVTTGGGGVSLGETAATAYRGDRGKIAYDHSQSQGNPHNTSTSDINEGTKLFFTESRVNQTVLTGLNTSTATPALATDSHLAAIGKLQAQINSIAPPMWVSAASIGTVAPSLTGMEFAKIDGNLWVRGRYQSVNALAGSTILFTLTNAEYRIETPESSGADLLIGQVQVSTNFTSPQYLEFLGLVNPNCYYFKFRNKGTFNQVPPPNYAVIQPTPIGKLLTP